MKLHSVKFIEHRLSCYSACNKGSVPITHPCSLCLWSIPSDDVWFYNCIFSSRTYTVIKKGIR